MPALHLRIGDSLLRRGLIAALYTCLVLASLPALARGHPGLVFPAVCAACVLAVRGRSRSGRVLYLARETTGRWTARSASETWQLEPAGQPTLLPWVVLMPFRHLHGAGRQNIWVFRDAVTLDQWRQLRVRLTVSWGGARRVAGGPGGLQG